MKIPIQGFLDLFFDAAPTIENKIEQTTQNTKAAFAKAAFDILQEKKTMATSFAKHTTELNVLLVSGSRLSQTTQPCHARVCGLGLGRLLQCFAKKEFQKELLLMHVSGASALILGPCLGPNF